MKDKEREILGMLLQAGQNDPTNKYIWQMTSSMMDPLISEAMGVQEQDPLADMLAQAMVQKYVETGDASYLQKAEAARSGGIGSIANIQNSTADLSNVDSSNKELYLQKEAEKIAQQAYNSGDFSGLDEFKRKYGYDVEVDKEGNVGIKKQGASTLFGKAGQGIRGLQRTLDITGLGEDLGLVPSEEQALNEARTADVYYKALTGQGGTSKDKLDRAAQELGYEGELQKREGGTSLLDRIKRGFIL